MDKNIGGSFVLWPGTPRELILQNTFVGEGAARILRAAFRGEATLPTNFFIGLTGAEYDYDSVVTDLEADEPSGNGYARGQVTRNTTDWTVNLVNGLYQAKSKTIAFTASAAWDKPWSRAFLASVVSGAGQLYAVSAPTPSPIDTLSGLAPSVFYQAWLRG